MKIIDLLNKIANGEELPKKIIAGDSETEYYFDKELKDYINTRNQEKLFEDEIGKFLKYYINDEVEILEEEKSPTLNNIRESYGLPRIEEKKIPEKLIPTALRGINNLDEKIED